MREILKKLCIPRIPKTEVLAKFMKPGAIVSIGVVLVLSVFLIMEMQTYDQVMSLNSQLETLQTDVNATQQIFKDLETFNKDFQTNGRKMNRNFADHRQGAHVVTFYGIEMDRNSALVRNMRRFFGYVNSNACNLLRPVLDARHYLQFEGQRAGVLIRLAAPVAIYTIKYEHLIGNHHEPLEVTSSPKDIQFYGLQNTTLTPILLGSTSLVLERNKNYQQAVIQLIPNDFYQFIRFDISSNHGNPDYTTVYKLSIFGRRRPE